MTDLILKALEYNTLPRFIYKLKNENFYRNYEADAANLIGFENPKSWVSVVNTRADIPLDLSDDEIFTYYILNNRSFNDFIKAGQGVQVASLSFGLDADETRLFEDLFYKIYQDSRERGQIIFDINAERQAFRKYSEERKADIDEFQDSRPWTTSDFQQISKNMVYDLEINRPLLGLFDSIFPNEKFPLISTNRYYKTTLDYSGVIEHPSSANEILLLFASGDISELNLKDTTTDPFRPKYSLMILEKIEGLDDISLFLGASSIKLSKSVVNGVFGLYPVTSGVFRFDRVIWADLVMNSILAEDFVIDESVRATKYAAAVNMRFLWKGQTITFAITETSTYDIDSHKTIHFIKVRVSNIGEETGDIEALKEKLAHAIGYYQKMAPKIAADYNTLLTDKINLETSEGTTKARLRQIAPEMFLEGYSRLCQALPRIIGEDEAKYVENRGFQVMRFPRDSKEEKIFACDQPQTVTKQGYIYPGLRENRLANKDKYPTLPCCFKEDQQLKKNSLFQQYYQGTRKRAARVQTRYLLTSKRVKIGQTGKLPDTLLEYFRLISPHNKEIVRRGVAWDPASIIDCILETKQPQHRRLSEEARKQRIRQVRSMLMQDSILCRQETWNIPLAAVNSILLDNDQFIDVSMTLALLEQVFGCRLVVFTAESFKQPNFSHGYLRFNRPLEWPVIVLYENSGGEAERSDYPQYELIDGVDDIRERLYADYVNSLETFIVSNGIASPVSFPDEKQDIEYERIQSQLIDQYGKVYGVNLVLKGRLRTFLFEQRLPPLRKFPISDKLYYDTREFSSGIIAISDYGSFAGKLAHSIDASQSRMGQFLNAREQMKLLLENAKFKFASSGRVEFRITDRPQQLSKFTWNKDRFLQVPNEKVKTGVEDAVANFRSTFPLEFGKYPSLKYVPFEYESIWDFQKDENTFLGEIDSVTVKEIPLQISEEAIQRSSAFFIIIKHQVFFCRKMHKPMDVTISTTLYVEKTRCVLEPPNSLRKIFLSISGTMFEMDLVQ